MQAEVQPPVPHPNQQGQLFHIAFSERRKLNIEKLKIHMSARLNSQKERLKIYKAVQDLFKEKVEYTKLFIQDISKYFEDTLSLYGSFFKAVGKLDLNSKPRQNFIYESFAKAALELTQLNNGQVESLKVLTNWIQKILLPALKALYDMYREWTKQEYKQLEKLQSQSGSLLEKQAKFYEKIGENADLLQGEIILVDKLQASDEMLVRWGKRLFSGWQGLLKKQGQLREELQRNILQFHQKFIRVYSESDSSKNLLKFWRQLQPVPTWPRIFASILNEKDIQFICFGSEQYLLKEGFEHFVALTHQKQRVGDPLQIIEILQNKRFKCKLQKSQRQYLPLRLYFTVDKNVLLFDETKKKVFMKLKESSFKISRLSENLIEVAGIEVGFFVDSKRSQKIHFSTMDEAEQFCFFVENLMKENQA